MKNNDNVNWNDDNNDVNNNHERVITQEQATNVTYDNVFVCGSVV